VNETLYEESGVLFPTLRISPAVRKSLFTPKFAWGGSDSESCPVDRDRLELEGTERSSSRCVVMIVFLTMNRHLSQHRCCDRKYILGKKI